MYIVEVWEVNSYMYYCRYLSKMVKHMLHTVTVIRALV